MTNIDILESFPLFVPSSAGNYNEITPLTIQSINQTIPALLDLSLKLQFDTEIIDVNKFYDNSISKNIDNLRDIFTKYGSDKGIHNYHIFYAHILKNKNVFKNVFEIGLGTNNTDVVSNMGKKGKPGASLRSFKEFLPNTNIYGADIDHRILFTEDRIKTFYVDQTNIDTFYKIDEFLPDTFDLIIDDGLHSPNANLITLNFGLDKLSLHGSLVIEDIPERALPLWKVVNSLFFNSSKYQSKIIKCSSAFLFFLKKIA
jgi:hypothetical protein